MGYEMTAECFFEAGQCAPRGTYISLETGLVHRLSKRSRLPERGPFRMVAPSTDLAPDRTPVLPSRWPEEETARTPTGGTGEPEMSNWNLLAMFRMTRVGGLW